MPSHATMGRIKWPPLCCPSDMGRRRLSSLLADWCKQNAFPSQTPHGLRHLSRRYLIIPGFGVLSIGHDRFRIRPATQASAPSVAAYVQITSYYSAPSIWPPPQSRDRSTPASEQLLEKAKCTTARLARTSYLAKHLLHCRPGFPSFRTTLLVPETGEHPTRET